MYSRVSQAVGSAQERSLTLNRREFLVGAAATALSIGALHKLAEAETVPQSRPQSVLKKGVIFAMLPESLSVADRFKLARDIGFDGVEINSLTDPAEIKTLRAAADKVGIPIHSVICNGWQFRLSSADPKVIESGIQNLSATLSVAKEVGAEGVLFVPGVVNGDTRYVECYERSQKAIKKLIPTAEKLGVCINIENVWNNFLLSPLEFARYIDEFKSPMVQAYFDVGNVIAFGWSEDWIRTLGPRIKKIHVKDFKRGPREWANLLDGDVNWPEVRKALGEVGYNGYMTCELGGGDEAYLRDISTRMDKIIQMPSKS